MNSIPMAIIDRDKKGVERLTYYGVPVAELDRDGLLAALNQSEKKARTAFESFTNFIETSRVLKSRESIV